MQLYHNATRIWTSTNHAPDETLPKSTCQQSLWNATTLSPLLIIPCKISHKTPKPSTTRKITHYRPMSKQLTEQHLVVSCPSTVTRIQRLHRHFFTEVQFPIDFLVCPSTCTTISAATAVSTALTSLYQSSSIHLVHQQLTSHQHHLSQSGSCIPKRILSSD